MQDPIITLPPASEALAGGQPAQTIPVLVRAEPAEPLYRRLARKPLAWFAAALVLAAVVAGALFAGGVFSSGSSGTAGVLGKDGYPVTMALSKNQLSDIGAFSGSDGATVRPYVTGASVGIKGGSEEIVIGLTPQGSTLIGSVSGLLQGSLGNGETAHMDGPNLVITGPVSGLGGASAIAQ